MIEFKENSVMKDGCYLFDITSAAKIEVEVQYEYGTAYKYLSIQDLEQILAEMKRLEGVDV